MIAAWEAEIEKVRDGALPYNLIVKIVSIPVRSLWVSGGMFSSVKEAKKFAIEFWHIPEDKVCDNSGKSCLV